MLCILSSFALILMGRDRVGCFAMIVFIMSCDCYCSAALPRGTLGWFAVFDFGIT